MKLPKQRIELAAAKDAYSRYNLNDVHLDVKNKVLFASDGHIAAFVPVEVSSKDKSSVIARSVIDEARSSEKRLKRKKLPLAIQVQPEITTRNGGALLKMSHEGRSSFTRTPAKLGSPDALAIIPRDVTGAPDAVFNAKLLMQLVQALSGDGKDLTVNLWINKKNSPTQSAILVKVGLAPENNPSLGVMMPMRSQGYFTAEQALASLNLEKIEAVKKQA